MRVPVLLLLIACCQLTACTHLIFQPMKQHVYTPDVVSVAHEDVYIRYDDGLRLHGWRLKSEQARLGAVLFYHGNGENISTHFGSVYWLVEHGYDVYLFDYRGYGRSDGIAEMDGVAHDAVTMLDYMFSQVAEEQPLYVLGHSLGGSLAIHAASEASQPARITRLIVVSAFSDYQDITQDVLALSWLTWPVQWPAAKLIDNSYRPLDVIGELEMPLTIMFSAQDGIVDRYHSDRLLDAAAEGSRLIELTGGHNRMFESEANRSLILEELR